MSIATQLTPTNVGELVEQAGPNSFVLGSLYLVSLVYASRRLSLVYSSRRVFDLPVMLVSSIVFNLSVRSLSFGTLAVLSFRNVNVDAGSAATDEQVFYQHVMAVLFNVGDWAAVSTYLLMGVVWVEMMQRTRKHFYSADAIRRDWMIAYVTLNTIIYVVMIGLYIAIFTVSTTNPETILTAVYAVLGFLNVALPTVLMLTWASYSLLYAGFPYRSREALLRWKRLTRLVTGWTVARLVWAAASLLAANSWALDALAAAGSWAFTLVCVSLFLLGELVPFLASLGTDVLRLFGPLRNAENEDEGEEEDGKKSAGREEDEDEDDDDGRGGEGDEGTGSSERTHGLSSSSGGGTGALRESEYRSSSGGDDYDDQSSDRLRLNPLQRVIMGGLGSGSLGRGMLQPLSSSADGSNNGPGRGAVRKQQPRDMGPIAIPIAARASRGGHEGPSSVSTDRSAAASFVSARGSQFMGGEEDDSEDEGGRKVTIFAPQHNLAAGSGNNARFPLR